jgi:hypothetical protein
MTLFKVTPRTFVAPNGSQYTIVGIRGRVRSLPISLSAFTPTMEFEFIDSEGTVRSSVTGGLGDFAVKIAQVVAAQQPQLTPEQVQTAAQQQAVQVVAGLLSPDPATVYATASALAGAYEYQMLSFSEQ